MMKKATEKQKVEFRKNVMNAFKATIPECHHQRYFDEFLQSVTTTLEESSPNETLLSFQIKIDGQCYELSFFNPKVRGSK